MAKTIRSISARFLKNYERKLPRFREAAKTAEDLVRAILADLPVEIHVITSRCNEPDSLRLKLRRKRYRQPGRQLTDRIGVRIITYFESDIPAIVSTLQRELKIDKHKSEDKRTKLNLREFGYLSVHLIARAKGRWSRIPGFTAIRGIWFEIQVRSILEHAWAEIEHETVYKSGIAFPDEIKRRFARLAGALEILSSEFFALRGERTKLVDKYVGTFKAQSKLGRDTLDSARLIGMLEVERPNGIGWRSASNVRHFPNGIESTCTEALKSAGIRSSAALRQALRSQTVRAAEKMFAALSLQAPTHLASALIVVATKSPMIFKDYFPHMAANPTIAPLLQD